MIDFHCHILPGFDDDPPSLTTSLAMAKKLSSMGFRAILATPRLLESCFSWQEEVVTYQVETLNKACIQADIQLVAYPGAEIGISPWVFELLSEGQLPTLNKSRYLLLAPPLNQPLPDLSEELFFRLKAAGYKAVLAHPERCLAFQREPQKLHYLRRYDLLYQLSCASITGYYGAEALRLGTYMLRNNLVSFAGSDARHPGEEVLCSLPAALHKLRTYLGTGGAELLLSMNPQKAINNEPIPLVSCPVT